MGNVRQSIKLYKTYKQLEESVEAIKLSYQYSYLELTPEQEKEFADIMMLEAGDDKGSIHNASVEIEVMDLLKNRPDKRHGDGWLAKMSREFDPVRITYTR